MSTIYRWEFGFDFNATADWSKVNSPNDPTNGSDICLLQNGLCTDGSGDPAWPSRLEVGDKIVFRIYDLTSVQGGTSAVREIPESYFSVVDPHSGDIPAGDPATEHPLGLTSGSVQKLVSVDGGGNPAVWPGGTVPCWEYEVDHDGDGTFTRFQPVGSSGYFTLSILLQVQDGGTLKWFGLDPEIWIMDG